VTYTAVADPYCYAGTSILRNIPGLRDQAALDRFEAISFAQRSEEPLPFGPLSVRHFLAVHRHLFRDVYRWAGLPRTIRLHKDGSTFCYPENIGSELSRLFEGLERDNRLRDLDANKFVSKLAHFLAELNAIHAFREGNGRTQLAFAQLIASQAGHPLRLEALDPQALLAAMIDSFRGDEGPLGAQLLALL
jgi:cell filamentation protein